MKFAGIFVCAAMALMAFAEKKIKMEQLPPAVQAAVKDQANGAELLGFSTERENGKVIYEAETKLNGKSRDLSFDASGKLLEVEQEVDLDSVPPPAREALRKRAAGGRIKKVESVTQGTVVSYEATITTKSGKHTEVAVNPDGTPHRG